LDYTIADSVRITLSQWARVSFQNAIRGQLEAEQFDLILAHSMGTVLGLIPWQRLSYPCRFVGIGSPLTHPLIGPVLGRVLRDASPEKALFFQNPKDPIAAFGRIMISTPHAIVRKVEHDRGHDWAGYFEVPIVQSAILGLH
jgi:hypothetical protein